MDPEIGACMVNILSRTAISEPTGGKPVSVARGEKEADGCGGTGGHGAGRATLLAFSACNTKLTISFQ